MSDQKFTITFHGLDAKQMARIISACDTIGLPAGTPRIEEHKEHGTSGLRQLGEALARRREIEDVVRTVISDMAKNQST